MERKLVRLKNEAVVGGVAAGLAAYLGIDKVLIRIIWVMSLLLPLPPSFGWTLIIYVIMWVVLPERDEYPYSSPANAPSFGQDLFNSKDNQQSSIRLLGVIIAVVGGYLLLDELVDWSDYRRYLWPIILISIGAYLVLRGKEKGSSIVDRTESTIPRSEDIQDSNKVNYYNEDKDKSVE
jgi:phage shock protein PspC (stress-responsive transcriptional regulator)